MYLLKEGLDIQVNKTLASETIGVTREHLTNILNRKKTCSKILAYCITKYLSENAEIEDYFIRKEE